MICDEPMRVSAVGKCNHAVCHVCALRVRVLADKGKKDSEEVRENLRHESLRWLPCLIGVTAFLLVYTVLV